MISLLMLISRKFQENNKNKTTIVSPSTEKPNEIIIPKIKKSTKEDLQSNSQILTQFAKEEMLKEYESPQDVVSLHYLLNQIPTFKQYILINGIQKSILMTLLSSGKYISYNANDTLFFQGDRSNAFYLILSGRLGFKISKKVIVDDTMIEEEREVNTLKEGNFFGEWGLIYNIKRTTTTYAKEPSIVLSFDKTIFNSTVAMNLLRSEIDRKVFICAHIQKFSTLNTVQFNTYYREIKKVYLCFNEEILRQNTKAEAFYLIYKGSCSVKKGNFTLLIKDAGDIIGIEALENSQYDCTVISNSSNTILFKFVIKDYAEEFVNGLKEEMKGLIDQQKEIYNKVLESHIKVKKDIEDKYNNLSKNRKEYKSKLNLVGLSTVDNVTEVKKEDTQLIIKTEPKVIKSKISITKFNFNNQNSTTIEKTHNPNQNALLGFTIKQYKNLSQKKPTFPYISTSTSKDEYSTYSSYTPSIHQKMLSTQLNSRRMIDTSTQISNRDKTERCPNRKMKLQFKTENNKKSSQLTLNEKIASSIGKWKKIMSNKKNIFETKRYKIPLININITQEG